MILAIIVLCVAVLLGVFFLGQYRGRNIEAAIIARSLGIYCRLNQETLKAYMTIKTDARLAELRTLARFKRFL